MKRINRFIKWLFGYGTPDLKKTSELLNEEANQIVYMQKSVSEIKVIHEEISAKLDKCSCSSGNKKLVINPKLNVNELRLYLMNNGVLETSGMTRSERQFYAKKIYFLRYKKGMKIAYDKVKRTYKYFKNGL